MVLPFVKLQQLNKQIGKDCKQPEVIQPLVTLFPANCESSALWRTPCMSGYRPGHEEGHNPYINYATQGQAQTHSEERVFPGQQQHQQSIQHGNPHSIAHATPQSVQHGGHQNINSMHTGHLGQHQHQLQHHTQQTPPQVQYSHHPVYAGQQVMAQTPTQQSTQYGSRSDMMHSGQSMLQGVGTKRQRPESMVMGELGNIGGQQMHSVGMSSGSQMGQQSIMDYPPQTFHSHGLPPDAKRLRLGEEESAIQSMGAPSVVGMEGMPEPAQRPRGPKLKFTPEDDAKLVDLKENKSLTWKQIADFFPGRSSGTLQVRYCTKLKAKTTQWTDETVSSSRCTANI